MIAGPSPRPSAKTEREGTGAAGINCILIIARSFINEALRLFLPLQQRALSSPVAALKT